MAKRVNTASFKGMLHLMSEGLIIEEFGKKEDDPSEFYNITDLLEGDFAGKMITITIKEEQLIPSIDESELKDSADEE
jgi:hypothetical protein